MEIWRGDCYYLKSLSSAAFQVELAKTQAEPSEAITDFLGEGSGLDLVNEVLEEEINKLDDDVVEQDKYNVGVDLNGINEVAEEDFQNLTDGEFEEDTRAHEEVTDFVEEGKILDEAKGQDRVTGDILKKQGAHKRLFKLSVSTGGSTKMRLVQAGRKGTLAKSGIRQGDGTKQTEDKGTSNPKPGPAKTSIDFMDHIITVTTLWEQWLASGFCFLKVLFCFGLEPSFCLTGLFLNKIGSFGYYVTDGMKFSRRNIYCLEDQWYNLGITEVYRYNGIWLVSWNILVLLFYLQQILHLVSSNQVQSQTEWFDTKSTTGYARLYGFLWTPGMDKEFIYLRCQLFVTIMLNKSWFLISLTFIQGWSLVFILLLVNKMKIMGSIRDWRLFGKNEHSDYNQHADRRRWSVVLPSSDIVAVGLWGYNFSGYH
ncbi:uncharacterized protein LOC106372719 isoform X1 [Brassica napus]|uniref:uncharacterized protein LOC106372719 isoform X1 n=1 Tax=Brassica napus TaxID=3708 RepID=UPI0020784F81|nr:uncharacterized protein LOC106372719 isoform X1 [Brassica napus]